MALQSVWYYSNLPEDIINIIEKDLKENFDSQFEISKLYENTLNIDKRNSQNTWIPTTHWVAGFLWHYVQRANRENFLYDLRNIDGESLQYTRYEAGQFYGWHNDAGLSSYYKPKCINALSSGSSDELATDFVNKNIELVRKLSFSLQLSDPDDYEGGNVQFIDDTGNSYIVPRKRGTIVLFDSRTQHRVLKVTRGCRKSIVGWVCGKRWS